MKRLICAALALAMAFSLAFTAFADSSGFDTDERAYTYTNQFSDVKQTDWFYDNVKTAYELGLMKGDRDDYFNAAGNVTIAETIAVAARLNDIYYGGSGVFKQGEPWYQVYVDFAKAEGIISRDYPNYDAVATRAEFAAILAKAFPPEALGNRNYIEDGAIPDVKGTESYADAVYMLYRAGILTGNDAKGTFTPDEPIERCAVAAIVTRMADPFLRKNLTLYANKNQLIAGIWTINYPFEISDFVNEMIYEHHGMTGTKRYFDMPEFSIPQKLTLKGDGTGTLCIDKEAWAAQIDEMRIILAESFTNYYKDSIYASGDNITVLDIVHANGYESMDELVMYFLAGSIFDSDPYEALPFEPIALNWTYIGDTFYCEEMFGEGVGATVFQNGETLTLSSGNISETYHRVMVSEPRKDDVK